jgi:methionyl-tRNA formyltransferase
MKIQILISKNSWANDFQKQIRDELKKFCTNIKIFNNHKILNPNYDINIIFSYFKKIPKKYLKFSKINLIPHESNLPKGKGMSPLTWQILKGKKKVFFSLIEASSKIDNGLVYYKKEIKIPKDFLFDEIKKIQLNENLKLIIKFIKFYIKENKAPKSKIQIGRSTFYKQRKPQDSEIKINKSLLAQFNLLRTVDNKNYPAFFKIYGKKYILKINKL